MKRVHTKTMKTILQNKFLLLLISLVVTLCVAPFVHQLGLVGPGIQFTCLTLVFVTAAMANPERKAMLYTSIACAVVAIPIMWSSLFIPTYEMSLSRVLITAFFCFITAVMILVSVFKDYRSDARAVFGAVCSYLLIGLAWAMLYAGIEMIDSEAFRYVSDAILTEDGVSSFPQLIYLSFVTMSTLGYGDIAPRTAMAQTAAWMQAVVGQFYFAVLISYLVATLPKAGYQEDDSGSQR